MRSRPFSTEAHAFPARLRSVVDGHGGASALARVIARSEGAVRKWLRGESEPNVTDLRAICEATATNVGWLVRGSPEPAPAPQAARAAEGCWPDGVEHYALLEAVLERVDTEVARAHLTPSVSKRAALIVTLYQLFRAHEALAPDAVTRLVKLTEA